MWSSNLPVPIPPKLDLGKVRRCGPGNAVSRRTWPPSGSSGRGEPRPPVPPTRAWEVPLAGACGVSYDDCE